MHLISHICKCIKKDGISMMEYFPPFCSKLCFSVYYYYIFLSYKFIKSIILKFRVKIVYFMKKNTNKSSCSVFDDSLPLVGIRCKWNFCVASTKHTPQFFSRFRWSFAWVFQRCVLIFPPVSERCESKFNKIWIFVFVQPCSWDN